jgi:polysaccharide deacetylase 2 family uncharacterized protein YibQ
MLAGLSVAVIGVSIAITFSVGAARYERDMEPTRDPAVIAAVTSPPSPQTTLGEPPIYRPSMLGPFNWPGAAAPAAPAPVLPPRAAPEVEIPPVPKLTAPALRPPPAPPRRVAAAPAPALPSSALPVLPPVVTRVLPPRTAEGKPAWLANALPMTPSDGRPEIAIIIDDAGVDRSNTNVLIGLKGPLTLSFLPYGSDLPGQARRARANGHEIMLHVPMEPHGSFAEPEPHLLRVRQSAAEIRRRLARDLDLLPGIVGINNHMGSLFTSDPDALAPVMEELALRGLLFVDSRTSARSLGQSAARAHGLPNAARDVFLDHYEGQAEVRKRLLETERVARKQGNAIAIGHPRAATLAELAIWLGDVEARGFRLVPVSAIVRAQTVQFTARVSAPGG